MLRRATVFGMALAILFSWLPTDVRAQEASPAQGVTISPSFKELTLGPGLLEAKTTITIRNNTGQELTASVRLVDFAANDEFGGVSFSQSGVSDYSLAKWMSIPNGTSVKLPSNVDVEIPVSIRNDDDLSPGGHYGAAIVSVSSGNTATLNGVDFKQELASLLFVKKTGGETYGLELESMKPENLPAIPKTIELKFKSTGNVHVVPRGYIEITDPNGTLIAKGIINPESTLVMPGRSRQFVTIMQPVADAKAGGTYKITAYYRYDGQEAFAAQSISFVRGHSVKTIAIFVTIPLFLVLSGYLMWRKKVLRKLLKKR